MTMTGSCCSSCEQGGPCEPPTSTRTLAVVQQAEPDEERSIMVWGPMSAEIPSRSGHLVRVKAVEKALPMLLRRKGATLKHKSDIVAHFLPQVNVDLESVPKDPKLQAMVEEVTSEYGSLPSAVLPVTQTIADVFPRLKPLIGEKIPFLATEVFGGDRYQTKVRNDILAGRLDSYSIDAPLYDVEMYEKCDEFGCITIQDVKDLELTGTTLCSSTPPRGGEQGATAMNPAAGFVVVQQAETMTPFRFADRAIQEYIKVSGIQVGVEYPRGSVRRGTGPNGAPWERGMLHHYGRILGTNGADGDMLDAYVGENLQSEWVYVIDQVDKNHVFDESKAMLGFNSLAEAVEAYLAHYPKGWRCGPVSTLTIDEFKALMETTMQDGPVSRIIQAETPETTARENSQIVVRVPGGESLFFRDRAQCHAWASELAGVDPDKFCDALLAE